MSKVELIHQTNDQQPFYEGAMISFDSILSYGFSYSFDVPGNLGTRRDAYSYHLQRRTPKLEGEIRKRLSDDRFKPHPVVTMELDERSEQGLVDLLEQRGEVRVVNKVDQFPNFDLFVKVKGKIKAGLEKCHIQWTR